MIVPTERSDTQNPQALITTVEYSNQEAHFLQPRLAPLRVWQAYALLDEYGGGQPVSELTALVALIRRACGIDGKLSPYAETVRRNFQDWIMKHHSGSGEKFNEEQMDWLRMIRDHIITSFHLDRDDLNMTPFDSKGGMGQMYNLFGDRMDEVINEAVRADWRN